MMKKLLLILLTLSVISVGCSDDDETVQPTTNLDSDLFGIWTSNEGPALQVRHIYSLKNSYRIK